jgi:hypothetical protein
MNQTKTIQSTKLWYNTKLTVRRKTALLKLLYVLYTRKYQCSAIGKTRNAPLIYHHVLLFNLLVHPDLQIRDT